MASEMASLGLIRITYSQAVRFYNFGLSRAADLTEPFLGDNLIDKTLGYLGLVTYLALIL